MGVRSGLVIRRWPWRQGGEALPESQAAACGMALQERNQEAFEGKYWVWYLLGGPISLRFFLHLISTIMGGAGSGSIIIFFSNLRIVMNILASFFQPLPLSAPDFQEEKNKGTADGTFLMWGTDFWVCLEFITQNAGKVYQISQASGEKTAGRWRYFFVPFSYLDCVSVLADWLSWPGFVLVNYHAVW